METQRLFAGTKIVNRQPCTILLWSALRHMYVWQTTCVFSWKFENLKYLVILYDYLIESFACSHLSDKFWFHHVMLLAALMQAQLCACKHTRCMLKQRASTQLCLSEHVFHKTVDQSDSPKDRLNSKASSKYLQMMSAIIQKSASHDILSYIHCQMANTQVSAALSNEIVLHLLKALILAKQIKMIRSRFSI